MTPEELHNIGKQLESAAAQGRRWVNETSGNAARVKSEASDLSACSLKTQSEARKLAKAASRRMCVGVFGPSQAGKSYLVSRLAVKQSDRPEHSNKLTIGLGEKKYDFVQSINPPGGKESTGLVTRFTTDKIDTPSEYPVAVRLFSETDLIRVFANSYFLDFDHHNLEFDAPRNAADIGAIIDSAKQHASGTTLSHLDEVAIYTLRDYFNRCFKTASEFLDPVGYWEAVTEFAPALTLEGRAQLFGVLWGGIEDFTELYKRLISYLAELDFAEDGFVPISALVPREESIIDVDRVKLELGGELDDANPINVTTAALNGKKDVAIPRATLCALVAELQLCVKSESWDFLAHTDLLDFPGARSREKYRRIDEQIDAQELGDERAQDMRLGRARELFIRGKVAMLFQRYSEERELSSMLLCMPPLPAEVKDLGLLVKDWVHLTHGATSAERSLQANALFLVLTKSDDDFKRKDGEDEQSIQHKWRHRLAASMRELFQRDGWVDEWDEENGEPRPFRNVLWLRNPGVEQAHLVAYEDGAEERREVGIATSIGESRLPDLKRFFLQDESVTAHFVEPEEAFDALLELNDGGISYLASRLAPVSNPETKLHQVEARLKSTSDVFTARFRRFFADDDQASRERKRAEALAAVERLGNNLATTRFRAFGSFLNDLRAVPEDFYELYLSITRFRPEPPSAEPAENEEVTTSFFDLMGEDDDDESPDPSNGTASTTSPAADEDPQITAFAEQAVSIWIKRVRDATPAAGFDSELREARSFGIEQIVTAVHRHGLANNISRQLHARSRVISKSWEDLAQLGAVIAASSINDVIATLGYAGADDMAKPPVPPLPAETRRRAFSYAIAPDDGLPTLGKRRRSIERDFCQDWLASMVQLTVDNAGFTKGREISDEQNAQLGEILLMAGYAPSAEQ